MTTRTGGLLELVARGKKDLFFTNNPTVSYYHSVYTTASATTKELYQLMPRNTPEWGAWVDFDLEQKGDLASKFYLRIQLPTWLPPAVAAANPTSLVTYGGGSVTYGYCQNVGYQMIEKVQVFNDTMLVEELYGEYLDWRLRGSYESGTVLTAAAQIGYHDNSPLALGRAASPGLLRVPLPLLGWQKLNDPGFPLCVCKKQRFRIRIWLRKLEELVVCSDGRLSPKPWGGVPLTVQTVKNGPLDTTQQTLPYTSLKVLTLSLETEQRYIPPDVRLFLQSRTLRIPFRHIQFHTSALEHNSVVAASPPFNSSVTLPFPLEFIGPSDRFLLGFRTNAATRAGQRTTLTQMITSARLNIANIDRIKPWNPAVFREVSAYHKQARMPLSAYGSTVAGTADVPMEVYTLSFGGYDYGSPAGTVSFTRAVLPVLYFIVAPAAVDPRLPSDRGGFSLLYCESWNVFQFANGGGKQMFDDI
jgi:hypothetical protein